MEWRGVCAHQRRSSESTTIDHFPLELSRKIYCVDPVDPKAQKNIRDKNGQELSRKGVAWQEGSSMGASYCARRGTDTIGTLTLYGSKKTSSSMTIVLFATVNCPGSLHPTSC